MQDRFETLIDPADLAGGLARQDLLIVDCRFDLMAPAAGRAAWAAGHVPGAVYADLDQDLSGPVRGTGGRHPLPAAERLNAVFSGWGLTAATQVVAYDDAGGAIAGRLWWLLRWMGHRRVAVLDGGYPAWLAGGHPVSRAVAARRPSRFEGRPGQQPVVDADAVAAGLAAGTLTLIDVRAPERFAGLREPLDRVAGHVPRAENVPLSGNLDEHGRFLPAAALRSRYLPALGTAPPDGLACMCGSGVSACHALLALEVAGLSGAALYAGSWSDWISDPARPVGRLDAGQAAS